VLVKVGIAGLALLALGVWAWQRPAEPGAPNLAPWLVASGAFLLVVLALVLRHEWGGSAGQVNRWSRRSRRNDGVAGSWAVLRAASALAVRRRAEVLRPSVRAVPWWQRWRVPTTEFATALARVGWLRIWSPVEDVTLRIGGPRTGKTGELACRIVEAPGAVIATSTRTDLVDVTGPIRSRRGPVAVFNPSGLGGLRSSVTFDPLSGCEVPRTAVARAADLLAGVSAPDQGGDREFWAGQARRVLAALLHAAALGGAGMRDVQSWAADPDAGAGDIQRALRRSAEPAFEVDATQFLGTNERTRSSICSTIMPALGWLSDGTAAAAATDGAFDVEQLLADRGTVYMLGADDGQVAPLVTALTGHIAREARRIASGRPGGRLDPPLTLALDEAALICPIPLDNWTADMGGRGVTIHIAAQSRAQLRKRWGDTGAAAILNNAATLMIYGGTRDPDDLAAYSSLTGERYEDVPTWNRDGDLLSTAAHRVPVLSPAQIAQLPAGRAIVVKRGMPPAIGRVEMAWRRRDVRAVARADRWSARTERWREAREDAFERLVGLLAEWRPQYAEFAERVRASHAFLRAARRQAEAGRWDR
jgi:type IV secretion system protein VirD4